MDTKKTTSSKKKDTSMNTVAKTNDQAVKSSAKSSDSAASQTVRTLFSAFVLLVIGILLTCSFEFGTRGLSWLVGVSLCVAGVMYMVNSLTKNKALLSGEGVLGAGVFNFGIMFIMRRMADILIDFVPFLTIAIGFITLIDALLGKLVRKEPGAANLIYGLVAGALITALGFCLKFINSWALHAAVIFGAVLIVYAVYLLVTTLIKNRHLLKKS